MEFEGPLYYDENFKIEGNSEYHLYVVDMETSYYDLGNSLQDLSLTHVGKLEDKLKKFGGLLTELNENNLSVDSLHIAFCQAYIAEKTRNEFKDAQAQVKTIQENMAHYWED